jgi:hypothetical protein
MSWFTENPWPLMLILSGVAVVMLILGDTKGRSIAVVFALLAAGVYFLESAIVTPAEQIEGDLQTMLGSFIAEDLNAINRQIDDQADHLKQKAEQGLKLVNLDKGFHMQDIVVTVAEDGQKAVAELRANGSLTIENSNTPYHAATRWRTHWKLDRTTWKMTEVHRLNPVTGDEIGVLDAQ